MARRYRYAFAKQKEAPMGKLSFGLFFLAVLFLAAAVLISSLWSGDGGVVAGGCCLFALMLAGYGFIQGLRSLSGSHYSHGYGIFASITNGLLVIGLIGLYLLGLGLV